MYREFSTQDLRLAILSEAQWRQYLAKAVVQTLKSKYASVSEMQYIKKTVQLITNVCCATKFKRKLEKTKKTKNIFLFKKKKTKTKKTTVETKWRQKKTPTSIVPILSQTLVFWGVYGVLCLLFFGFLCFCFVGFVFVGFCFLVL